MTKYLLASQTITYGTIIDLIEKTRPLTHTEVADLIKIDPTEYDMSTRLWNMAKSGLLKKTKFPGDRRNRYTVTPQGKEYLKHHRFEIQKPGKYKPIKAGSTKKHQPTPQQKPQDEQLLLSKISMTATEGIGQLVELNEALNLSLEQAEEILCNTIGEGEKLLGNADKILGMPLAEARKKNWPGIFNDVAQLALDNIETLSTIKELHAKIDDMLRNKYDYADDTDTE